jgi:hypothetical protein
MSDDDYDPDEFENEGDGNDCTRLVGKWRVGDTDMERRVHEAENRMCAALGVGVEMKLIRAATTQRRLPEPDYDEPQRLRETRRRFLLSKEAREKEEFS